MTLPQPPIRFASFLGDNAFDFYRQVVAYLGAVTGLTTQMVATPSDQTGLFELGKLEAAFACGLPYVWQAARADSPVRLLAAPVMPGARYAERPVYFADLIVHRDSPYRSLADLRGATFAYNQATSMSGYVLPRYHLLTLGETFDFFQSSVPCGSHANAMDWVESGRVACAAIDSVVLAMELQQRPERAAAFRVVESMGPAAMPPVIVSSRLSASVRAALSQALTNMHTEAAGQALLRQGGMRRFAPVTDAHYDDIRHMLKTIAAADGAAAADGGSNPAQG